MTPLAEVREYYREIAALYATRGYYAAHPLNAFWAGQNMDAMRGIIESAVNDVDVVRKAHQTYMFSVNTADRVTDRAVQWLLEERSNRILPNSPLKGIEESAYSHPANNTTIDGKRYTPDFLRCINIAAEIRRECGKGLSVIELGGGLGHLARVLALSWISSRHVIIDLPETLVFSYCFLRLNFPFKKLVLLREGEALPAGYDFAFVPTMLANQVLDRPYDLFLNTASMGEMRNEVIRKWMIFVQTKLRVKHLFMLNRFLNTINDTHAWRLEENECQQHYDARWEILRWELEPRWTRCPFVDTLVSRYVEIIARRTDAPVVLANGAMESLQTEDWWRLRGNGHIMAMRDNPICVDGTQRGTLFKLWEAMRLHPSCAVRDMLLAYLERLNRNPSFWFEELPYYKGLTCTS